jgi:hypothetical protein
MAGQLLLRQGDTEAARSVLTKGLAAAQRVGNRHAESEISALLDDIG